MTSLRKRLFRYQTRVIRTTSVEYHEGPSTLAVRTTAVRTTNERTTYHLTRWGMEREAGETRLRLAGTDGYRVQEVAPK